MKTIANFQQLHSERQFRHSTELMAAIRDGLAKLNESGVAKDCAGLLPTYRVRARHLAQIETQHAQDLLADVEALCKALEAADRATLRFWIFELPHGRMIDVFENEETHDILGCIKVISKLRVSEAEWDRLWNKN